MNEGEWTVFGLGVFIGVAVMAITVSLTLWATVEGDVIQVDNRHFVNIDIDGKQWFEFDPTQPITFTQTVEVTP